MNQGVLETYRNLVLDEFQAVALDAISKGESVIVAAPTGAGKTLIAEYAIEKALKEGKRVVYTAPIKALSNQKFRDFSATYPGDVGITTGDVSINPAARATIMTTEIFRNTIFDAPERLRDVATVIFDEIHYLDDPERGTVWEESLIFAPPEIKVVALSATISNLNEFADWLRYVRGGEVRVVLETNRPVPLSVFGSIPGTGIVPVERVRHVRAQRGDRRAMGWQGPRDRGGRGGHGGRGGRGGFGGRGGQRGSGRGGYGQFELENKKLILELSRRNELPALFFLFSRDACEKLAMACIEHDFFHGKNDRRKAALSELTSLVFAYDLDVNDPDVVRLRRLIEKGIAYHHAGLLPALKEIVEVLFSENHVRALFATETFALGVNMPARAVAFEGLKKWNGVERVALKTREFQQMAGRAGRRGIDTKGDVFVSFDPEREDPRLLEQVVNGKVEPVESQFNLSYSTILNLYSRLGDKIYSACEKSFANWRGVKKDGEPDAEGGPDGRPKRRRSLYEEGSEKSGPRTEGVVRGADRDRGRGGDRERGHKPPPHRPGRGGEKHGRRHPRNPDEREASDLERDEKRRKKGGGGRRSRPGRAERHAMREARGEKRARMPNAPPRPASGTRRFDDVVEQVDRKLELLRELGYIEGQALTEKGRFAASVYGHELQMTELVFAGVFDKLTPAQVAVVSASIVYEGRRDDESAGGIDPRRAVGDVWRQANRLVRLVYEREVDYGIRNPVKVLDWKLSGVTWAWANDAEFSRLREYTDASDGDIVRNLRQTIQLMRLVSEPLRALARGDLANRFASALKLIKRGLVDAEWQLRRAAELEAERIAELKQGITHVAEPEREPPLQESYQEASDEDLERGSDEDVNEGSDEDFDSEDDYDSEDELDSEDDSDSDDDLDSASGDDREASDDDDEGAGDAATGDPVEPDDSA